MRFDAGVYSELSHDPTVMRQAARVVGIVTATAALGTSIAVGWHAGAILGAALAAVVHWVLWTGLIYLIATTIFHSKAALPGLYGAMGYAQAPQVIAILGFIPVAGPLIVILGRLLTLVSGHQALVATVKLERRRMLATNILAFIISLIVTTLLKAWLGDIGNWDAAIRP